MNIKLIEFIANVEIKTIKNVYPNIIERYFFLKHISASAKKQKNKAKNV